MPLGYLFSFVCKMQNGIFSHISFEKNHKRRKSLWITTLTHAILKENPLRNLRWQMTSFSARLCRTSVYARNCWKDVYKRQVPIMAKELVLANCPYLKVGERMPNMHISEEEPQLRFA